VTHSKPFPCLDVCNYVSYSTLRCFLSFFKGMAVPSCFIALAHRRGHGKAVAYPGILFGGGGFQQIQLRTEDRQNGDLGAVAP